MAAVQKKTLPPAMVRLSQLRIIAMTFAEEQTVAACEEEAEEEAITKKRGDSAENHRRKMFKAAEPCRCGRCSPTWAAL
jgi:hypothetical protein